MEIAWSQVRAAGRMGENLKLQHRQSIKRRCGGDLWLQGYTARESVLCSIGNIFDCVH
jgi:hypothetical protein